MLLVSPNLPAGMTFDSRSRGQGNRFATILQNDANAAAYGEYCRMAKDARSLVFFTLGTGSAEVSSSTIISSKANIHTVPNTTHSAADNTTSPLCTGQYGTAEAYCSATSLLKRFQEAIDAEKRLRPITSLCNLRGNSADHAEEAEKGSSFKRIDP